MKKKLAMIIATILSVLMCFSVLAGCNIVTINNEKDMTQVVAEVDILNGAKVKQIKKRDMIVAYLNYGYYYAYSGYTQAQVFDMIIENLVGTEIMLQYIMNEYESSGKVANSNKAKYTAARYLGGDDLIDAEYDAISSVNALIDGYVDEDPTYQDAYSEKVRAIPSGAVNDEEEKTPQQKQDYIDEGIFDVGVGEERHKAYNKVIRYLKNNGVLGNYKSDIKETTYYNDLLVSYQETKLLEVYSEEYTDNYRKNVNYASLENKYAEMYSAQKNNSITASKYEEALSGATVEKPVVYSPFGGYGYVYNLLLGVSETQSADIEALKKDITNKQQFAEARRSVLEATVVKDLRSSWILSGYDYDFDTNAFTGDYTFTSSENSLKFEGKVNRVKEKTEDEKAVYNIESVRSFGLDEFVAYMDNYLYGKTSDEMNAFVQTSSDVSTYRKVKVGNVAKEYSEKINELLFAYSTDDGSLNTYKGYVISPEKDLGLSEKWVKEFADAGRELLEMGGNSYIIVASDYGYHVMFYSSIVSADAKYATLNEYLDSLGMEKPDGVTTWAEYLEHIVNNWEDFEDSDFYLYNFANLYMGADNAYAEHETEIVDSYRYSGKVKVYEERFKDLLGE